MLEVTRMQGYATIQDSGRAGHRAEGVPPSGAMDPTALERANVLVGNPPGAAAIEWALAGGSVRLRAATIVAVTGARAEVSRNGERVPADVAIELAAGDELTVGRFVRGRFMYVGVRGGIDVPVVLGSRSTYVPAGFGGLEGRRLKAGDELNVGIWSPSRIEQGELSRSTVDTRGDGPIRVVERTATDALPTEFREAFWASEFTVSRNSDRVGFRLDRAAHPGSRLGLTPSGPVCVGTIQVPAGDSAIVLMPDGPTVGGYPWIGVVASVDLPVLAQKAAGETVRFERIGIDDAQSVFRRKLVAQRERA